MEFYKAITIMVVVCPSADKHWCMRTHTYCMLSPDKKKNQVIMQLS